MFALAAGVSEYFHNEWCVATPVYSLALLDGFGRLGHDAHWFSDVVGGALLGVGTTELFIWLHNQRDEEPRRWRIFSMSEAGPGLAGDQPFSSATCPTNRGHSLTYSASRESISSPTL
jgi:hypothetical protein